LSNVPESSLKKYMRGAIVPSALALRRIGEATDRSLDWLSGRVETESGTVESGPGGPDQDDFTRIPILDVTAGAGWAVENGEPSIVGYLPFPTVELRRLGVTPSRVRGIRSSGDSMLPTIADDKIVLINTAISDLKDGRIYALSVPDGLRLKRIQRQFDGAVLLISDNKELYEPDRVPPHEAASIRVIGHAFWTEKLI